MSHSVRLAKLLRSFNLSPGASADNLRKAYLREAKHLHPDATGARANERGFIDLKARYEEALALLARQKTNPGAFVSGGSGKHWDTRASGQQHSQARPGFHATATHNVEPVVGLPTRTVHAATAFITISLLSIWALLRGHREESSPPGTEIRPSASEHKPINQAAFQRKFSDPDAIRDATEYHKRISSEFRKTRSRPPKKADLSYGSNQIRDGVALNAMHVAAQDGETWFLERCGTVRGCIMPRLDEADRRGDTPLHHCAKHGQMLPCRTLLRLGANASIENKWHLRPEDIAAHNGHSELVRLLRAARRTIGDPVDVASRLAISRHPDGLGVLRRIPADMFYIGPYPTYALRQAVNNGLGEIVVQELVLSGSRSHWGEVSNATGLLVEDNQGAESKQNDARVESALKRVHFYLEGSGFELEPEPLDPHGRDEQGRGWWVRHDGAEVRGFLVYEPDSSVTLDAPGHWCAIAPLHRGHGASGEVAKHELFFRLDSVRGTYQLTSLELAELVKRYPARRLLKRAKAGKVLYRDH